MFLGIGITLTRTLGTGGGSVVPGNAIRDRAGAYINDRTAALIYTRV